MLPSSSGLPRAAVSRGPSITNAMADPRIPATMNCTTVRVIGSRPTESFAMNAICKPTNSADSSVMASPKPNESDSKPSANETNPTPTTQSAIAAML